MVPVDEAEEADEESSSKESGSSPRWPVSSSSSSSLKTSAPFIAIFFFAQAFCKSLMLSRYRYLGIHVYMGTRTVTLALPHPLVMGEIDWCRSGCLVIGDRYDNVRHSRLKGL